MVRFSVTDYWDLGLHHCLSQSQSLQKHIEQNSLFQYCTFMTHINKYYSIATHFLGKYVEQFDFHKKSNTMHCIGLPTKVQKSCFHALCTAHYHIQHTTEAGRIFLKVINQGCFASPWCWKISSFNKYVHNGIYCISEYTNWETKCGTPNVKESDEGCSQGETTNYQTGKSSCRVLSVASLTMLTVKLSVSRSNGEA